MNDAAIWFALFAVAVMGWAYAFILAMEVKRWRKNAFHEMQVAEDHMQHAWELEDERSEIMADVGMLESLLKAARKNDNRDASGRFAKANS